MAGRCLGHPPGALYRFCRVQRVLLWAAGAEKPVIAPNYGLLGALVNKYALGEALDTTDSGALAEAMERFVSLETSSAAQKTGMQRFTAASTPEAFCRTFFEFA